MRPGLSDAAFARLLDHLDPDRDRAGERYEDLRRTLVRFFEWRGAPFPEEHADDALDRVARRLAEGVEIQSIGSYCYTIARLIVLEARKGPDSRRTSIESSDVTVPSDTSGDADDNDARLSCLERCLDNLPPDARELIIEYYRDSQRRRIDRRKALAERLGLKAEALANRAQRLRDKLERCVTGCLKEQSPT